LDAELKKLQKRCLCRGCCVLAVAVIVADPKTSLLSVSLTLPLLLLLKYV
jgi:hypothetical protein